MRGEEKAVGCDKNRRVRGILEGVWKAEGERGKAEGKGEKPRGEEKQ